MTALTVVITGVIIVLGTAEAHMLIAIGIHVSSVVPILYSLSDCRVQWTNGTINRESTVLSLQPAMFTDWQMSLALCRLSLQWANGTINPKNTVTVPTAQHCTQGRKLHSSSITDMQYTASCDILYNTFPTSEKLSCETATEQQSVQPQRT